MLRGIPFFDNYNTNEIYNKIKHTDKSEYKLVEGSLYKLVTDEYRDNFIVVIDNYLTWLKDIKFNYRDKECYIPYYTFKLYESSVQANIQDFEHIYEDEEGKTFIRYDYELHHRNVDVDNLLFIYDLENDRFFAYHITSWIDDTEIDLKKLHDLYVGSCYKPTVIDNYYSGYHYIDLNVKGMKNTERRLRKVYYLSDYSYNHNDDKDYRDVREYRFEEVLGKTEDVFTTNPYWIRRLEFESYLYCCLRKGLTQGINLEKSNEYTKIGKNIPLIIKGYWLNGIDKSTDKEWKYAEFKK